MAQREFAGWSYKSLAIFLFGESRGFSFFFFFWFWFSDVFLDTNSAYVTSECIIGMDGVLEVKTEICSTIQGSCTVHLSYFFTDGGRVVSNWLDHMNTEV